jgi:hypothetical protein
VHHKTHQPVFVTLRPSRIGGTIAIVLHALAVLAALDAPEPWLAAALLLVVLASAVATARAWRGCARQDAVHAIERDGAGRWWVETGAGERVEAALAAPPVVTRSLVALSFRVDERRWDLALLPDSAAPDDLRRLRVALRTRA